MNYFKSDTTNSAVRRYLLIALLMMGSMYVIGQNKTISGTVTDSDGEPLIGATVIVSGTSNGVITDFDGNFTIEADENGNLEFSYTGYERQIIPIAGTTNFNIVLSQANVLDEVVVIGYGEARSRDVTGAISKINSKDFNVGMISTPDQLFTGKVTGIQVTPTGGQPGASSVIAIRGVGTLSGSTTPLYVVDGFPLDDVNPLPVGITFDPLGQSPQRSPLTFINPNDIASITVLKDASATAIYGSRASNGVVVIQTKSTQKEGQFFDFGSSVSVASLRGDYGLLSADEYRKIDGTTDFGGNTDWTKEIIEDQALSNSHYMSFGNSNESGYYVFSMGYDDQAGILKQSNMERITARLNTRQDLVKDFLSARVNLQVTHLNDDIAPVGPSLQASGNLIAGVLSMNPTIPITDGSGVPYQRGDLVNGTTLSEDFNNPKAILDNYTDVARTQRILGNASLKANFLKNLAGTLRVGVDRSFSNRETALGESYVGRAGSANLNGIAVLADSEINGALIEGLLDYNVTLGPGKLKALIGYSYQEFELQNSYVTGTNPDTAINWVDLFGPGAFTTTIDAPQSAINGAGTRLNTGAEYSLQSYFARLNYDIDGKYLLTATIRRDGSSKFGENNKYGTFPSVSAGWVISEETFSPEALDFLKLRAGWGITGSQAMPASAAKTIQTFGVAGTDANGNILYNLTTAQQGNPDLKWESSEQINLGLDFGLVDNRITGSIDYFNKVTNDLVVPIGGVAGLRWENLDAELTNAGLEFLVSADMVKKSDLWVNLSANLTLYTTSEVTSYSGALPLNYGFVAAPGVQGGGSPTQRIEEGAALGQWFLPAFGGYDSDAGVFITDPQQVIDGADAIPDYNFGVTLSAAYKSVDFSIVFNGAGGHQVLNVTDNSFLQRNRIVNSQIYNSTQDQIDKYPGDISQAPPALSSQALEDGDFIRLANLNLGYTFGAKSVDWLEHIRVFFSGQNLALWSDYSGLDPEVNAGSVAGQGIQVQSIDNGTYPRAKVFTFGLQASF